MRWELFGEMSRYSTGIRVSLGFPLEAPMDVHRGGGPRLPVREDFLIIRTFSQGKVESSPLLEVFKRSLYNHKARDSMLLANPTRLKAP